MRESPARLTPRNRAMHKTLTALAFVAVVPLAFALAQGVVPPPPQGGSYGVQAQPAVRDFWSLTDADPAFTVPQGRALVVTGAVATRSSGNFPRVELLVDGVPLTYAYMPEWNALSFPSPGLRVDPGSSVDHANINASFTGVTFIGYLADL